MKIKSLTFGLIAASAMMTACSSDELVADVNKTFEGDKAYIAVSLNYVTGAPSSRATAGGFDTETTDENKVSTLDFYFFDNDGYYLTTGKTVTDASWTQESGNIAQYSNAVVVLENLTGKSYPTLMVVVANKPSSLSLDGLDLTTLQKKLVSSAYTTEDNTATNFVMSSVSYYNDNASGYDPTKIGNWFAVPVKEENFLEQAPNKESLTKDNAVTCYIERLAAKVQLSTSESLTADDKNATVTFGDGTTITGNAYKVTASVRDLTTNEGGISTATTEDEEFYVVISNWGLNCTVNKSYLGKVIDPSNWTLLVSTGRTDNWSIWTDPSNHRSYWGESVVYGQETAKWGTDVQDENGKNLTTSPAENVTYTSWNNLDINLGSANYCFENTNSADGLKDENKTYVSSRCTSALVKAVICTKDGDTYTPANLYIYENILMTESSFKALVLSDVKLWKKDNDDNPQPISYDDVTFKDEGKGKVSLAMVTEQGWYSDDKCTTETTDFSSVTSKTATAYKSGMCYYCIPIEHLNSGKDYTLSLENLMEADYGVVRNHYYQITINSISNLGHAVYDPDEIIIPDDDDNKLYYIGATINVLSWKTVSQDVDL